MVEFDMCALGAMDEHGIHIKKRTNMWMEEVAQCYVALSHSTHDAVLLLECEEVDIGESVGKDLRLH